MSSRIRVLHVDDEAAFAELAAEFLEREDDRLAVAVATSAAEALDRMADGADVDCVVSDYDMPGRNGIEFLEAVREDYPDLPFFLFTGKGSEEVASDAISSGATDYLQKQIGTEQYELLANRIVNAVEQHRAARERTRVYQALETATQGIGLIDADGTYVYLNEAYADLYGYEPEELVGSHWRKLYPDEEVRRFNEDILPELEEAGQWQGRSRGLEPDGTTFPEQLSLTRLEDGGHVCVVQDVSDRRERERQRRRNERRFEALFEDPNLLIGLLDPDGNVRDVNRTALGYVDADREDLRGEPFWETPWWTEDNEADLRAWIERAADGEYVKYEAVHSNEDGEDDVHVAGVVRPVTDESGEVVSLIVSARETTERVERQRRLERQNERFDELASVVTHDLQTPLQTARGRLELAAETVDSEHVEAAMAALDSVDDVRADLASMLRSRAVVDDVDSLDLESLARSAWEGIDSPASATLEVDGRPRVEGDRDAVLRLFQNLLSNAVEHGSTSPDSPSARQDAVEHGDGEVTVIVGPLPTGFYVEDSGPGIPESNREEVFTAGFTTKAGGSGIGMASVRHIVEAHGWEIAIEDGPQLGGARFEVTT